MPYSLIFWDGKLSLILWLFTTNENFFLKDQEWIKREHVTPYTTNQNSNMAYNVTMHIIGYIILMCNKNIHHFIVLCD